MHDTPDTGLIEAHTLAERLRGDGPSSLRLVDASFAMAGTAAAWEAFSRKRIGAAVFFDIDAVADHAAPLPHMLPAPEAFAAAAGAMGIGDGDTVVVYDQTGMAMAAARVWWIFRVFGHDRVCVLNGGLPYWETLGLPVRNDAPAPPRPRSFTPRFQPALVADGRAVLEASPDTLIIDARAPERYAGTVPEPRPGLRRGHVPGSINISHASLLDADGRMKPPAALADRFGVLINRQAIVSYCGSGVTACVPVLALFAAGMRNAAVYDGSWTEWGQQSSGFPVE